MPEIGSATRAGSDEVHPRRVMGMVGASLAFLALVLSLIGRRWQRQLAKAIAAATAAPP